MSEPYFATGYIRLLYQFARAERLPADQLLRNTGLSEADLMRADVEVPFAVQMRLCENAIEHAAPGLGLRSGYQLQLAAHGALGTAMQSALNLDTALRTLVELIAVRASFLSLSMSEDRQRARIEIVIDGLPERLSAFFCESTLSTLMHCLTFFTGRRESVGEIHLQYAEPSYGADYERVFGGSVEFDASETWIALDRKLLNLPSPEADAQVFADSVARCRALIEVRGKEVDVLRSIETFLQENPGKLWTVEEIAPLFAISSRTLIRRLKEAGTTYQALRDDVLKRQATGYLKSMSVEAAAVSLGFADSSSFRRTFRRWFGVTPSEFSLHD